MTKSDDAHRCFMSRFTCSAAVFSAFSEELGLDPDMAKKSCLRLRGRYLKDRQYLRGGIRGGHGDRAEIWQDRG